MYACIPDIDGGFFEGVCGQGNRPLAFRDPPHLSSIRDLLTPVLRRSSGVRHHYWQHQTVEAQGKLGGGCYDLLSGPG